MTIYLNQRSENRSRINGSILYSRNKEGTFFNAALKDCTPNGIGMITSFPYLPATTLYLATKTRRGISVQPAKVTWSKALPGSSKKRPQYRIGTQLLHT